MIILNLQNVELLSEVNMVTHWFHLKKEAVCFRNVVYCLEYFYDTGKVFRFNCNCSEPTDFHK
jgi:hypothetical protein